MSDRVDGGYLARRVAGKWWLILCLAVAGGMGGYAISLETQPVYEANVTLLVGDPSSAGSVTKESIETSQLLATTYVNLIRSETVLSDVATELGLRSDAWRDLKDQVRTTTGPHGSQSIKVTVYDDSAVSAQNIAEAVGDRALEFGAGSIDVDWMSQFTSEQIDGLRDSISAAETKIELLEARLASAGQSFEQSEIEAQIQAQQELIIGWQNNYSALLNSLSEDDSANSIQIIDSAATSASPVRPNLPINVGAGSALGALVAIAIAYMLAFRRLRADSTAVETDSDDETPPEKTRVQSAHAMTIRAPEASSTLGGN